MKKTLFIATGVALLLAFLGGTLYYSADKAGQAERLVEQNRAGLVREHAPTKGNPEARVQIVEFLDPACETCKRFYPFVQDLMRANHERIHLVLRYTPFHENSAQVVALLHAAAKQGKHWETLEVLLTTQGDWVEHHVVRAERVWPHLAGLGLDLEQLKRDMAAPAVAAQIAQDLEDARRLNVTKTPEFFVNGKPLPSFGYEPLKSLVDEAIAGAYR